MKCRHGILALIAAAVVASSAAAAQSVFTPKSIAGNWKGTWTNERFGSTGPASIVSKSLKNNTQLTFTADFGGNVFGCADPPKEGTKPLTKGTGANHWSAKGFTIQGSSQAFGALKLTYVAATGKLTGGGGNPPCAAGLTWTIDGTFTGKTFAGKVNITLPDKTTAVSDIALTRG
ncbi:MAG: hypothetical protein ACYDA3_10755 [Gaiellaceae bacterium]